MVKTTTRSVGNYPFLSEAVKNLLALHGLEAEAESQGWNKRGNRSYMWKVTKIAEPAPVRIMSNMHGAPVKHTFKKPGVFYVSTQDGLDKWMGYVAAYARGDRMLFRDVLDFETYSGKVSDQIKQLDFATLEARVAQHLEDKSGGKK